MSHFVHFDAVFPNLHVATLDGVIEKIISVIAGQTGQSELFLRDLLSDPLCDYSLGIDEHLAILNTKVCGLRHDFIGLAVLNKPILMQQRKREKHVDLIGILLTPERQGNIHLRGLSRLSRALENKVLQTQIREIKDADVLLSVLNDPDGWLMAA
jgi:mannitol/fructose-specific phosphotransferase system IIA component (Ntr-type)